MKAAVDISYNGIGLTVFGVITPPARQTYDDPGSPPMMDPISVFHEGDDIIDWMNIQTLDEIKMIADETLSAGAYETIKQDHYDNAF